jgi:acylphosphatase
MSDAVRTVAVVSGHVQGVGYRYFVRGLAGAAGLEGSARNLADGRVEVVLEGPADAVHGVVAELDGPRSPGSVARVDVRSEAVQGDSAGFTVL